MDIIGKCPFFGTKCLKEDCTAFEYTTHIVWENKDDPRYRHFEKERMDVFIDEDKWVAVGIPFCRALKRELPMNMADDEKYPHNIAYGIRP